MKTFFRIQTKNISLAEMQQHLSANGADDTDQPHDGLCACETVSELRNYIDSFAVGNMDEDFEVLVVRGRKLGRIYDGVLIYPEEVVERVSVSEFYADDRFYDLEDY